MSAAQLLLFAQASALWVLVTAGGCPPEGRNPLSRYEWLARSALGVVGILLITGSRDGLMLAAVLGVTSALLLGLRSRLFERGWLAELEVLTALAFASVAWSSIAADLGRFGRLGDVSPDEISPYLIAGYFVAAIAGLATWHSGNVVAGVLRKTGVAVSCTVQVTDRPDGEGADGDGVCLPDETTGVKHGRIIGYLERLLIVLLVAHGRYEGLGFLVAAKGVIRLNEFKNRSFAEYFLVGSLLSVLCAVVLGLALRWVLNLTL